MPCPLFLSNKAYNLVQHLLIKFLCDTQVYFFMMKRPTICSMASTQLIQFFLNCVTVINSGQCDNRSCKKNSTMFTSNSFTLTIITITSKKMQYFAFIVKMLPRISNTRLDWKPLPKHHEYAYRGCTQSIHNALCLPPPLRVERQ